MRTRFHRHANLEPPVGGQHVVLPFRVAGRVAREILRRGHAFAFAADGEPFQQRAIEPDVDLMRLAHTDEVVVELPLELELDEIFAVHGELIIDGNAAARAERQILAHPLVLHEVALDLEDIDDRPTCRVADGQPADHARRRQIVLQQCGRYREDAGNVVEALLFGIVGREHGAAVDLEAQEIANGVGVFGAVQPVHRHSTRIGICQNRRIERTLQMRSHRGVGGFVGARSRRRRHLMRAKLPRDLFPHFDVCTNMLKVELVDHQAGDLALFVVTSDAIFRQSGGRAEALGCRSRGCLCLRRAAKAAPYRSDRDRAEALCHRRRAEARCHGGRYRNRPGKGGARHGGHEDRCEDGAADGEKNCRSEPFFHLAHTTPAVSKDTTRIARCETWGYPQTSQFVSNSRGFSVVRVVSHVLRVGVCLFALHLSGALAAVGEGHLSAAFGTGRKHRDEPLEILPVARGASGRNRSSAARETQSDGHSRGIRIRRWAYCFPTYNPSAFIIARISCWA